MWLTKLRSMKEKTGKTTKEISQLSGIPEPTLEKLFAGVTKDPKLETMRSIVKAMGFTLNDLAEDEKETQSDKHSEPPMDVDTLASLLTQAGVLKEGRDLTDSDLRFLAAIVSSIEAWFTGK